jgi:hypothetical protein
MLRRIFITLSITLLLASGKTATGQTQETISLGYLDSPGSALVKVAANKNYYTVEGLSIELKTYGNAAEGLTALNAGAIQVGAFPAAAVLRAISQGSSLKIIAGGGTPKDRSLLAELDQEQQHEHRAQEIIVVVRDSQPTLTKTEAIKLVTALIRAHQALHHNELPAGQPVKSGTKISSYTEEYLFDPNPDYYRLEPLWQELGLQRPEMRRDHLAGHVYEEIYCDALDRIIVDGDLNDPVLKKLFKKAICVPNCCPAYTGKLFTIQGGTTQ